MATSKGLAPRGAGTSVGTRWSTRLLADPGGLSLLASEAAARSTSATVECDRLRGPTHLVQELISVG